MRVLTQYVSQSKRYIPEVMQFLHLLLIKLLKNVDGVADCKLTHLKIFKAHLAIKEFNTDSIRLDFKILGQDVTPTDAHLISVLIESISILTGLCKLYSDCTTVIVLFKPIMSLIDLIPETDSLSVIAQINDRTLFLWQDA
jgi:hypothetical protein